MPLQNRVDPWGVLHAVDARGTLMGNRGILHDEHRQVVRDNRNSAWITCLLHFGGRHRDAMPVPPTAYTSLFLLDEATALSAGHRPCFECRRDHAVAYVDAFLRGAGRRERPRAGELDAWLAEERREPRAAPGAGKRAVRRRLGDLPDGAMLDEGGTALLVDGDELRPWSFDGYGDARPRGEDRPVWVLTPATSLRALRGGYRPTPLAEPTRG